MAPSVKSLTLNSSSDHDLWVVGSSSMSGSLLNGSLLEILSLPLPLSLLPSHLKQALSLSNNFFFFKKVNSKSEKARATPEIWPKVRVLPTCLFPLIPINIPTALTHNAHQHPSCIRYYSGH